MTDRPAAEFSVKPTLIGQQVVLRPFAEDDLGALRDGVTELEVLRLTGSVHDEAESEDPDSVERLREWYRDRGIQPDRLDLAVVDKTSGQCVGEVVLNEWSPGNRSCNFRTCSAPPAATEG